MFLMPDITLLMLNNSRIFMKQNLRTLELAVDNYQQNVKSVFFIISGWNDYRKVPEIIIMNIDQQILSATTNYSYMCFQQTLQ